VKILSIVHTTGADLDRALRGALASLPVDGILVVAGGDGTVGRAAIEAGKLGRTLAIVPTGTGNDVARSLGLPLSPEEAIGLIATAIPAPMDLVVTDGGSFAHAATVGMNADFARRIRDVRGWRRPVAYPFRAWQAWRDRGPLAVELFIDGLPLLAPRAPYQVAIVNAPRLGGRIGMALPGSAVDDGLLEAVVSYRGALRFAVAGLIRLMYGNIHQWPGATVGVGQVVEVRSATPFVVSFDGEPSVRAATSLRVSICTAGCFVLRPRRPGRWIAITQLPKAAATSFISR
jgi:diacylglycerol kinase family enzyme